MNQQTLSLWLNRGTKPTGDDSLPADKDSSKTDDKETGVTESAAETGDPKQDEPLGKKDGARKDSTTSGYDSSGATKDTAISGQDTEHVLEVEF